MRQVRGRWRGLALQIGLVVALVSAGPAWGQGIIAQWNFDSGNPCGNSNARTGQGYEAQVVDPNATAADLSLSDAIPDPGGCEQGFIESTNSNGGPYPTLVLRIPTPNGSNSPDLAVLIGSYFEVSMRANCGSKLNLTSLEFDVARGGDAVPRGWVLQSDVDGFCAYIDTETVDVGRRPNLQHFTVDLSGCQFQGLTEVSFRLFTYTPSAGQSLDWDNITINGTVQ